MSTERNLEQDPRPQHDYVAMVKSLLHLGNKTAKGTTALLGVWGILALNSPDAKAALRATIDRFIHIAQAVKKACQDDLPAPTAVVPSPDSTLISDPVVTPPKVPRPPKKQKPHKEHSKDSSSVTPVSTPENVLTAAQQRQLLAEQEGQAWQQYISTTDLSRGPKVFIFGGKKERGFITNSASIVTYRNIVMRLTYLDRDGQRLNYADFPLPGSLQPGGTLDVKQKFKAPQGTENVVPSIIAADYVAQ